MPPFFPSEKTLHRRLAPRTEMREAPQGLVRMFLPRSGLRCPPCSIGIAPRRGFQFLPGFHPGVPGTPASINPCLVCRCAPAPTSRNSILPKVKRQGFRPGACRIYGPFESTLSKQEVLSMKEKRMRKAEKGTPKYSRMTWTDRLNIEKLFNSGLSYQIGRAHV